MRIKPLYIIRHEKLTIKEETDLPDRTKSQIAALVACRNEERHIAECLRSLAFCDEIIVVDDFSRDRTPELARPLCSRFLQRPFIGCNDQKDFARKSATSRWVLNIDADERVTAALRDEILAAVAEPGAQGGFTIPVKTFIGDRWIRHAAYWPNRKKRLFLCEAGYWDTGSEPHDRVILSGSWGRLNNPIEHYTADSSGQMRDKILRRAELAAARLHEQKQTCSRAEALLRSEWRWLRSYILERGFLEGRLGLDLAELARMECSTKYRLLREMKNK